MPQFPASSVREIFFPAIPDARAAALLALQYQLDSSQWWLPDQLRENQLLQFGHLLSHAVTTVPYYRQMFTDASGLPNRITEAFFHGIPISTRDAIQGAGDDCISSHPPEDHGPPQFSTTSGSTGRPVRFARTVITNLFWLALGLREHLWHDREFQEKFAAIRWFKKGLAQPPAGISSPRWGPIVSPIFDSGPSASLNITATLEQQIDWLWREKPSYLLSFPSNLVALVRHAEAHQQQLPPLKEILTVGETLSTDTKQLLERRWNCKVADVYTCEEAGYLALQCPEAGSYHVQSENVIVEIIDKYGQPCPVGMPGKVLITTLHNFATPLIRYELGDIAEWGEPCSCGRGLPVIKTIHGRKRNRLYLPSGSSVFPYLGEHGGIARLTGIKVRQFQCIQLTTEDIELRLVLDRPLTAEEQFKVGELMQKNLGYPFRIACKCLDSIPAGPTGKFEEFISLVRD